MRIHGLGAQRVGEVEPRNPEPVGPMPRAERTSPATKARGAQRIVAALSHDEATSAERVAAVRAAIENGTYRIDFEQLAERIADEEIARRQG
jgi:flagellar biosynthesis anti-sigma factor FlgM